jgi:hypothetical protein
MAKRTIAYILLVLGFLIYIFFRKYNGGTIPYPFAFWTAGVVMLGVGWWWLRHTPTIRQSKEAEAAMQFIRDLKTNGENIRVDLNNCEVKENNYTEERLRGENYGGAIAIAEEQKMDIWTRGNTIYRNNDRVTIQINQTVVVGEVLRFGKPFKFRSAVLRHDRETLLFKMFGQKETTLYIDRNDPDRYYLDMEFLSPQ